MKTQEKDTIFITRFFDLDLSDSELATFEKRMSKDIAFRQKVNAYEEASTLIYTKYPNKKKLARSDHWKKLSNKHIGPRDSKKNPWRWIGGIAAGLVLLFSIWQLNTIVQPPDMDQLIADSWNKKVGLDFNTIRSTTKDSLKKELLSALTAYENKNYNTAINMLQGFDKKTLYYEDALLLKGLSYYKNGDTKIALQTLDTLSQHSTGKKTKVALWYKGLINLEEGNTEVAKQFLDIPDDNSQKIKLKE